ncbi:MAG: hypothetical protein ACE5HJ_08860 [Thermoplasmata archaeon]
MPSRKAGELGDFVAGSLVVRGSCYFHCDQETTFRALEGLQRHVGLYHCPAGYVSRMVYYDVKPDLQWFLSWVRSAVAPLRTSERDVRVATRHGWEFGIDERPEGGIEPYVLRQVYWTQPRPSSGRTDALYICLGDPEAEGCGSLFVQAVADSKRHCPSCLSGLPEE